MSSPSPSLAETGSHPMLWLIAVILYMIQVWAIYTRPGLWVVLITSTLAASTWYYIAGRSDNIYLDGVKYDFLILACYLILPLINGWVPELSRTAIVGLILAILGICLTKF